ncbi:MAG: rRNA maturation RNase YbeY [Fluviicola sp.]|nr:MAG: rRNA maturation RNase YbeY [Fluviicola sp.]
MINIEFVDREYNFDISRLESWLTKVATNENKTIGILSLVLGSDEWLLEKNVQFLNHDYYTDIITFDYTEDQIISGDLLISLDRVTENAESNNVSRETELMRVVVHGALHLLGYDDKSKKDAELIRKKEDYYLSLL